MPIQLSMKLLAQEYSFIHSKYLPLLYVVVPHLITTENKQYIMEASICTFKKFIIHEHVL